MRSVPLQEFEIELEGSQCLRILCYETCYDKSKINKDDNEIVDKIMGKGQVQVRERAREGEACKPSHLKRLPLLCFHHGSNGPSQKDTGQAGRRHYSYV